MIYFSDYKQHSDCKINPTLLWEYDLGSFDWQGMKNIVIQRVVERGWPNDYYAMLNLYGDRIVRQEVNKIPYLNDKDMNCVCQMFNLKKEDLKCFKNKLSRQQLWNS